MLVSIGFEHVLLSRCHLRKKDLVQLFSLWLRTCSKFLIAFCMLTMSFINIVWEFEVSIFQIRTFSQLKNFLAYAERLFVKQKHFFHILLLAYHESSEFLQNMKITKNSKISKIISVNVTKQVGLLPLIRILPFCVFK